MKLTERLFDYLSRVFSRDPKSALALRVRYDGAMVLTISDAILTTSVTGGTGAALSVDLRQHTITSLADFVEAQPGYSVEYENPLYGSVGARTLLDVVTDQDSNNGDHLYIYTSQLLAFLEAYAEELTTARKQIPEVIKQMSIPTANDAWLDELGDQYGIRRNAAENDAAYGPRMIAEILMARNNNIAIEEAIRAATGVEAEVVDAELQVGIDLGGGQLADSYGLFDVEADIELAEFLEEVPLDEYAERVYALIDKFRAGGTHLRQLKTRAITRASMRLAAVTISGALTTIYLGGDPTSEGEVYVAAASQMFETSTVYPLEA